ncbi:hypothetical protein AVEN_190002-1 [Araneus ventricosus]|uniref:Uncharacterized protein n=1 Tax=Araneus ventricosus TaxID=182803 RepID=A0A4Y2LA65_ARAVE|nr:hypothetical protein AVEN_190002-1 [Araneus ventricosus]
MIPENATLFSISLLGKKIGSNVRENSTGKIYKGRTWIREVVLIHWNDFGVSSTVRARNATKILFLSNVKVVGYEIRSSEPWPVSDDDTGSSDTPLHQRSGYYIYLIIFNLQYSYMLCRYQRNRISNQQSLPQCRDPALSPDHRYLSSWKETSTSCQFFQEPKKYSKFRIPPKLMRTSDTSIFIMSGIVHQI